MQLVVVRATAQSGRNLTVRVQEPMAPETGSIGTGPADGRIHWAMHVCMRIVEMAKADGQKVTKGFLDRHKKTFLSKQGKQALVPK